MAKNKKQQTFERITSEIIGQVLLLLRLSRLLRDKKLKSYGGECTMKNWSEKGETFLQ
jgi:hypothetical protein